MEAINSTGRQLQKLGAPRKPSKGGYICPQTWLNNNKTKTNIGLSPTMGFLNEGDSLAYFAILGELSSGLFFIVGFSRL